MIEELLLDEKKLNPIDKTFYKKIMEIIKQSNKIEKWIDLHISEHDKQFLQNESLKNIYKHEQQDWQPDVCIDCKYFNTDECPRENEENTGWGLCVKFKRIEKPKVENINVDDMYIAEKKVDKLEEVKEFYKLWQNKKEFTKKGAIAFNKLYYLFEQAIEQIIKALKYCQDDKEVMQNEIDILKQKKPNEECIEWLKAFHNTTGKGFDTDGIYAKKLLEYFGEN